MNKSIILLIALLASIGCVKRKIVFPNGYSYESVRLGTGEKFSDLTIICGEKTTTVRIKGWVSEQTEFAKEVTATAVETAIKAAKP